MRLKKTRLFFKIIVMLVVSQNFVACQKAKFEAVKQPVDVIVENPEPRTVPPIVVPVNPPKDRVPPIGIITPIINIEEPIDRPEVPVIGIVEVKPELPKITTIVSVNNPTNPDPVISVVVNTPQEPKPDLWVTTVEPEETLPPQVQLENETTVVETSIYTHKEENVSVELSMPDSPPVVVNETPRPVLLETRNDDVYQCNENIGTNSSELIRSSVVLEASSKNTSSLNKSMQAVYEIPKASTNENILLIVNDTRKNENGIVLSEDLSARNTIGKMVGDYFQITSNRFNNNANLASLGDHNLEPFYKRTSENGDIEKAALEYCIEHINPECENGSQKYNGFILSGAEHAGSDFGVAGNVITSRVKEPKFNVNTINNGFENLRQTLDYISDSRNSQSMSAKYFADARNGSQKLHLMIVSGMEDKCFSSNKNNCNLLDLAEDLKTATNNNVRVSVIFYGYRDQNNQFKFNINTYANFASLFEESSLVIAAYPGRNIESLAKGYGSYTYHGADNSVQGQAKQDTITSLKIVTEKDYSDTTYINISHVYDMKVKGKTPDVSGDYWVAPLNDGSDSVLMIKKFQKSSDVEFNIESIEKTTNGHFVFNLKSKFESRKVQVSYFIRKCSITNTTIKYGVSGQ